MTPDPFPSEQIPGPDLGACPDCGGWRKAGVIHRCTPDPFPNELVEAAAKAAMEAEPGQNWECATAKEADVYLRDSLAVLAAVVPLIEQRARLDERERLSSRVHENGWCPTCARDTDEAAMQRLAGKPVESLSRTDLIGLALRNLSAAMDAEARAAEAEQRVIDKLAKEAGENPYPEYHRPEHEGATGYADPCHAAWSEGAACGVAAERAKWETLLGPLDLSDPRLDEAAPLDTLSVPQSAETWRAIRAALASPGVPAPEGETR